MKLLIKILVLLGTLMHKCNAQNISSTSLVTPNKTNLFDGEKCGERGPRWDYLIRGNRSDMGEFPWSVLLEYQTANGEKVSGCAGALINKRYVLTSARCLQGRAKIFRPLTNIILGEWNIVTNPDCIEEAIGIFCADPIINITPDKLIPHPNYNDNGHYENDIGLIRLSRDVSFTEFIKPICLPDGHSSSSSSSQDIKHLITGWGLSQSNQSLVQYEQQFTIDIIDHDECNNKFGTLNRGIYDSQLCVKETHNDCFSGDLGGPLLRTNTNRMDEIDGVMSFQMSCSGDIKWPKIFTKVSSFIDWINDNMRN